MELAKNLEETPDNKYYLSWIKLLSCCFETKSKQQLYMNNIIYLHLEPLHVNTLPHEMLNINNKICKLYVPSKKEWIYFRLVEETNTTFSGIRLQQDRYNITKFYLTDEKNKWHGILADQAFSKGRWIYVCD